MTEGMLKASAAGSVKDHQQVQKNIESVYPLSPMQQGMLFHSLYAPESGAYIDQISCILRGELNLKAFEQAWQVVVKRQSVLRTSFVWKRLDRMLQVVQKDVSMPIVTQDWRGLSQQEQADKLQAYLTADRAGGFDLAKPPLMRLALMQIEENLYLFVWSHHHALMDGWSVPLLLREVLILYETYSSPTASGQKIELQPVRPYRDYIAWLQEQDTASAQAYWSELLKGITAPTPLIVDGLFDGVAPDNGQNHLDREVEIHLSKEITANLTALARRERITLSTLIQGAWAILLSRYSGEPDVLFGATVSGRPAHLAGAETMIGLFINTLPVRINVQPQSNLVKWLQELQNQSLSTRQYEYSALTQIQGWSEVPRGLALFESIVVFENYPVEDTLKKQMGAGNRLSIEQVKSYEQTNYPLTLVSGPSDKLGLKISFDPARFSRATINRILGHVKTLLEGMLDEMNQPAFYQRRLIDLPMLTVEEEEQILVEFGGLYAIPPERFQAEKQGKTIHQLFSEQARQTPNAIAVILDEGNGLQQPVPKMLTYAELDQRSDNLAQYLRSLGVSRESLVGLFMDRSLEVIISILGVLKAGAAYVPIDTTYPAERIEFMLEDSSSQVVLTRAHLAERIPALSKEQKIVMLDKDWDQIEFYARMKPELDLHGKPSDLAYVIFTSGSTGRPKGVMVEHHSLVNLALNYAGLINLSSNDRALQFISLSFDASGEEIFSALITGATLILPVSVKELTTDELYSLVDRQKITVIHLPVAIWHQWVEELSSSGLKIPESVRIQVVGGESPAIDKFSTWCDLVNQADGSRNAPEFINAYGPTEATIAASYWKIPSVKSLTLGMPRLPIGKGLVNNRIFILDQNFQLVPIGVPGEIFLGGEGVARGYLNRPELTDAKFITNPLSPVVLSRNHLSANHNITDRTDFSGRYFRTGDLGRYLPDGNIEFMGRVDEQVKIRGFRIELGEIETILSQSPRLLQVAVIVREDEPGKRRLVAYCVPVRSEQSGRELADVSFLNETDSGSVQPSEQVSSVELRQYLLDKLPDFMVPSHFVFLDKMPLTPNGKIDRRALPVPEGATEDLSNRYVAPRTPVESLIVGVWEQILSIPRIGVYDNFFDLGGHSLVATRVISRLRNIFRVEVPVKYLFDWPTVASLANQVESMLGVEAGLAQTAIEPLPRLPDTGLPAETLLLSYSQQRLWFLDQLAPGNLFYNLPLSVEISGKLDPSALEKSINEIISRHSVLRTNFTSTNGIPSLVIHPTLEINLKVTDLTNLSAEDRFRESHRLVEDEVRISFNLESDPLLRAALLRVDIDRHIFILIMHHIISDGWSMGVFFQEVSALYRAFIAGKPSSLPDLQLQYFDYANWQRKWLQGEQLDRQLDYWKLQLTNQPRLLELPTDHPRPAIQSSRGAMIAFNIPSEVLDRVKELCQQEGVTLFMSLLAAYQLLLARYSGQEDISVGTAIANRNRMEVERLIGFFVNTLVLRTNFSNHPTGKELLKRVREVALGAYAHQDLPFEMLVEALQPDRDLSHTPLFQAAFALQNVPLAEALRSLTDEDMTGASDKSHLRFTPLEIESRTAKFDLMLTLSETKEGLAGGLEYNCDLFEPETIQRMIEHYINLLQELVAHPESPVDSLPMLSKFEMQELLFDWNQTELQTPVHLCAHELFERQVQNHPEGVAVIFQDTHLTYQELNARANLLANYLLTFGIGPDVLVGIATDRSLEMVIGILGIMKAGGAYLPLDPTYPVDRLAYMIQDSAVSVLLTQQHLVDRLLLAEPGISSGRPVVVCLDADWQQVENHPLLERSIQVTPENLAYMIYTSGSTGKPKGTMLRHRGLSNLTEAQRLAFHITAQSRVLQFSPLSFDASVWETFMALANGATLVLARQETLASGEDLLDLLRDQAITTVTLPPSVLRLFSAHQVSRAALPALETVISAGEACTPEIVALWAPEREFFNAYGPTETTVCASMYHCTGDEVDIPPIGRPIANTKLYILDRNLQPLPIGIPGELHISGVSLATGYRNQPQITAQKFIKNPFTGLPEQAPSVIENHPTPAWYDQMYKTGDLVRYRQDGNIEFLGRIDYQVKVRGFRIELGEIEIALEKDPLVNKAVVIAQGDSLGDKRLAAFIIGHPGQVMDLNEIKHNLRKTLPEYMVPTAFVALEEMPLTPSGKVDRKKLAEMQITDRPDLSSRFVPPRNEVERSLAQICADLLRIEKVGIYDNFFELGGHSLLATQFVSRVRDEYHVDLPLRQLFESPTVASIAEYVMEKQENIRQDEQTGKVIDRTKLLEMMKRIGELSEAEVKDLLEQKKKLIG